MNACVVSYSTCVFAVNSYLFHATVSEVSWRKLSKRESEHVKSANLITLAILLISCVYKFDFT